MASTLYSSKQPPGFTLIELSLVLVIIGLIVGGVLVGRDLIAAAAIRAQITQIEKYQQATNAFKGKYGMLPGDISDPTASSFGFQPRGPYIAEGDGNGIIQATYNGTSTGYIGIGEGTGETTLYWRDLSDAKLIDGSFTTATATTLRGTFTNMYLYLPYAKIDGTSYVYVYEPGLFGPWAGAGVNYFGISAISKINGNWSISSSTSLTVKQAFAIDSKIDDGRPQTGNVLAQYLNVDITNYSQLWAGGPVAGASNTAATPGSATTCFDNNGVAGTQQYSMTQNNGGGVNCAISIKFQ